MNRGAWWATVQGGHTESDMAELLSTAQHSTSLYWGFPVGSDGKESACNAGDTSDVGSIPGSGSTPGEGNDNSLQYPCLENLRDRGAWQVYSPWGPKE